MKSSSNMIGKDSDCYLNSELSDNLSSIDGFKASIFYGGLYVC